VPSSFATRWLAPRLHRFVGAHPELDVRINASTRLIDPDSGEAGRGDPLPGSPMDNADIVVRYGTGDYPGYRIDKLLQVAVTPMCSPRLRAGGHPLRNAADLKQHVLIHDNLLFDDGRPLWEAWFEAAGMPGTGTTHGLRFSHAMLALEAAADGMGVALGMTVLAESDLASGRLVAPLALSLPLGFSYYIVSGTDTAERSDVSAFRRWLLAEAARDAARAGAVKSPRG
jgi:LysR family glycine cleavage system transcriptional activator